MHRNYLSCDFSKGYPAGASIRYECGVCGSTIPSMHEHSVACKCRNVIVDVDAGRVAVKDNGKLKAYVVEQGQ